jgi:hypothetical protein
MLCVACGVRIFNPRGAGRYRKTLPPALWAGRQWRMSRASRLKGHCIVYRRFLNSQLTRGKVPRGLFLLALGVSAMCLRGFVVLFLGLVFLISSLCAPSSSIMPIACASILPAAHVKNSPREQPALGCAGFAPPPACVPLLTAAKRGFAQVKTQVINTPLSFGKNGPVGIGTTSPSQALTVVGNMRVQDSTNSYGGTIKSSNTAGLEIATNYGGAAIAFTIGGTEYARIASNGNVGHSDNRPGFRNVQIEYGGREEVKRICDLRTPGNSRQNAVIVRRSAFAPSVFGYCFGAIPPHCGPVFRAS